MTCGEGFEPLCCELRRSWVACGKVINGRQDAKYGAQETGQNQCDQLHAARCTLHTKTGGRSETPRCWESWRLTAVANFIAKYSPGGLVPDPNLAI